MLVLSRKRGESIHIGPDITLTLIEIKGNRVRMGIKAPDDVSLIRAELVSGSITPASPNLSLSNRCTVPS